MHRTDPALPDSTASQIIAPANELVVFATQFARRRSNPPPGQPGHDHWGGPRPPEVDRAIWAAYGDHGPGSYCRWLSQRAERAWGETGGPDPAAVAAECQQALDELRREIGG